MLSIGSDLAVGLGSPEVGARAGATDPLAVASRATTAQGNVALLWRVTLSVWVVLLAGYALLDKGFAYFGVPGTPLYVGEILVASVVGLFAVQTGWFRNHRLPAAAALVAFCTWGALRTAPSLGTYGLAAVRDAALWYYAVIAALPLAWFRRSGPDEALDAVTAFIERLVPVLLLWTPLAVYFERNAGPAGGPLVPGSDVALLTHKVSNIVPLLVVTVLYALHHPSTRFSRKGRGVLFCAALVNLALIGTQNRGSFLGGALGLVVGSALLPRRARFGSIARWGAASLLVAFVLAFSFDVKLRTDQRDVGVRQLTQNMLSVVGQSDPAGVRESAALQANAQWRLILWTTIIEKTFAAEREITGWGFGPNLGDELGFENQLGDGSLRSPHNSHLSVFARMGVIGLFGWVVLWSTWTWSLAAVTRRGRNPLTLRVAAGCAVAMSMTMHVNAYFDPAYESPPAAVWLWSLFGVGCGLMLVQRRQRETTPAALLASAAIGGSRRHRPAVASQRAVASRRGVVERLRASSPNWRRAAAGAACVLLLGLNALDAIVDYDREATGDRTALGAMSDYRDAIYEPVRALALGINPYDHVEYRERMPVDQELPPYFPHNYAVFAPLVLLPLPVAASAFYLLSALAVGAIGVVVARVAGGDRDRVTTALVVTAVLLASLPGFRALQAGQSATFLALTLAGLCCALLRGDVRWVGICVAVCWAKPSIGLPLAACLFVAGHRRAVLWGSVAAFATWIPVGLLLLRNDSVGSLIRIMIEDLEFSSDHPFGQLLGDARIDVASTVAKLVQLSLPSAVQYGLALAVLVVTAVVLRRSADQTLGAAVLVLGTLFALWRQPYDLVMAAGPIALLVMGGGDRALAPRQRLLVAASLAPAAFGWGFSYWGARLLGLSEVGTSRLSAVLGLSVGVCWAYCAWLAWRSSSNEPVALELR